MDIVVDIPYRTKVWREKSLAKHVRKTINLANKVWRKRYNTDNSS